MLNKKIVKSILLEVESCCYNYEKYLQEVIDIVFNDDNNIKYIIARESDNGYLTLYKYNESDYILWLYNNYIIDDTDINDLINNYEVVLEYVRKNYIDYYVEDSILNFINIRKFRKELYNNKSLLQQVINNIYTNIRNYKDNEYLIYYYNLNKKLYHELKKIQYI